MTRTKDSPGEPTFLFATCQIGAERALKNDVARRWPDVHPAFSRPGFLTFKTPADHPIRDDFELPSPFARSFGISFGKAAGATDQERAECVWQLAAGNSFDQLHVWQRDLVAPRQQHFAPSVSELARQVEETIRAAKPSDDVAAIQPRSDATQPGDFVLDCVLVEPHEWWIGLHRAAGPATCWVGGICPIVLPSDAVSRAFLKIEEAIRWSQLPLVAGEHCVEIGCAPGGASQALAARGLRVTGIDPADVDPVVLALPGFTHIKKRGADVRRREFADADWLTSDINVAPKYTLDTVEAIVTHPATRIRGLLLTLKLLEWDLAAHVPEYLDRVRSWGFASVRARQLSHDRQELCVAAERKAE